MAAGVTTNFITNLAVPPSTGDNTLGICIDSINECSRGITLKVVQGGSRNSAEDFKSLQIKAGPDQEDFFERIGPRTVGNWSNGTTMWVSSLTRQKIFAYNLKRKERETNQDFNTLSAAGNTNTAPYGIWSDETTMWVLDRQGNSQGKIYAYNMTNKQHLPSKDFNVFEVSRPVSLWSDGTTIWVGDESAARKIYAYHLTTDSYGTRDDPKDFDLTGANERALGIWSDGTTMWVLDSQGSRRGKIYAYNMENKQIQANRAFDVFEVFTPSSIWSDGTTIWVLNESSAQNMLAYYLN